MKNRMYSTDPYLSKSAQRQRGLSLVELMVALVISLFLTAGVIQLFIGSKQTYNLHDASSRIQENGRFAIQTMARDIRMTYYPGGGVILPANTILGGVTNGNDSITVVWSYESGDDNGNPGGANAGDLATRFYSIRPSTSGTTTSLFLQRDGGLNNELVEGVEAMQIRYGVCIDTDGDGRIDAVNPPYINAAAVTAAGNWGNVCSVRIDLRLVSLEDNIVTATQTLIFPADTGTAFTPNPVDRRLRQGFSTTVLIRHRILL